MPQTPDYVLDALEVVRESAETNMLDRKRVAELVDDNQSREWLEKASNRQYMHALNEMGNRDGDPGDEDEPDDDDDEEWEDDDEEDNDYR